MRIHGDHSGNSASVKWGGHIMVLGSNTQLRISDTELFDMGQAGELGKYISFIFNFRNRQDFSNIQFYIIARYPIHYHVTRSNKQSYVRRNSIHDTYQRCVTVHGTGFHFLLVFFIAF